MSDIIRANVSEFLTQKGISFAAAVLVGETQKPQEDGKFWVCDEWRVTLRATGTQASPAPKGKADITLPYFTGTGHRKPSSVPTPYPAKRGASHRWEKPVTPHAADVLHSILSDAEAIDMSFADWCDNFGYDSDSLKALSTYNACCEIGKQLRQLFIPADVQALREMLQDY